MAYRRYSKKPAVTEKAERVLRPWSIYQLAIYDDIENGTGNTHVEAKAGSGKTSSICEGFHHLPAGYSALMCAFAKPIQIELEKRAAGLPITVLTMHSLGYRTMLRAFPRIGRPDNNKLDGYIKAEMGDEVESIAEREEIAKLISLAKGYLAETPEEFDEIMDRHEVCPVHDSREDFIARAMKIMSATGKDTNRIDFDDMVWMPLLLNLNLPKYDFVFIDEAQDLNKAQIKMALDSVTASGRILTVGDVNQAIFAFRGADSNAINNIVTKLNSKILPLSITYRCAKAIVELAKTIVPEIEASPTAADGLVQECSLEEMINGVRPGDFILSRTNAPLMRHALHLIKAGVPANIQGKDIGNNWLFMIKLSGAQSVSGFLDWLDAWRVQEVERLAKKRRDTGPVQDKYDCLSAVCEGHISLDAVKNSIKKLFNFKDENKDCVILSTTHRAKGLERDRVYLLNSTYKPANGIEEANLYYVGITRARKELYLAA
jgi:DNA helicase II / ATP-dependent DNA helicase PcrA